jgi:hypothetical protein
MEDDGSIDYRLTKRMTMLDTIDGDEVIMSMIMTLIMDGWAQ